MFKNIDNFVDIKLYIKFLCSMPHGNVGIIGTSMYVMMFTKEKHTMIATFKKKFLNPNITMQKVHRYFR